MSDKKNGTFASRVMDRLGAPKPEMAPKTFYLPTDLVEWLETVAEQENRKSSHIVEAALRELQDGYKPKQGSSPPKRGKR